MRPSCKAIKVLAMYSHYYIKVHTPIFDFKTPYSSKGKYTLFSVYFSAQPNFLLGSDDEVDLLRSKVRVRNQAKAQMRFSQLCVLVNIY